MHIEHSQYLVPSHCSLVKLASSLQSSLGQFETQEEKEIREKRQLTRDCRFSTFLLERNDRTNYEEANEVEEEEEDEDSEDEMAQSGTDKEDLKEQFKSTMIERFLNGQDTTFVDYSAIDNNEEYDDMQLKTQDEEDAYFDESDEEGATHPETTIDDREFNPPLKARKLLP
eukprot:sb/3472190/